MTWDTERYRKRWGGPRYVARLKDCQRQMKGADEMAKHYGLKARPIEIAADDTPRKAAGRALRQSWHWLRWRAAVILRLRWR